MDEQLKQRLDALEKKIDETFASTEKTRKYIFWSFVIALIVVVGPLLLLPLVLPSFLSTYGAIGEIQ